MVELLAPAGTSEALKAAVNNGCDAIYLGMNRFGARAYATNFDYNTLKEALDYAHLHNVKIYVTMNTIVFESELEDAYKQIDELYKLGVDALIIQDIALINYVKNHCPDMEAHASTQMGIDDSYAAVFVNKLGAQRVVLGRECSVEQIKKVKNETNIPVEVFVHGALCVSYSGNCLMSGLIGYRSGNRGRCVGSCRKPYELIDVTNNKNLGSSYILSMKDLKTIENIHELDFVDSLKIEGRMKEPTYVANVVSAYRKALDNKTIDSKTVEDLNKTFQRTYTKGYIFNEEKKNITNVDKPNHFGYYIGKITNVNKGLYEISLVKPLNQNDIIRIDSKEEINYPVVKMYDKNRNLINKADTKAYIYMKEKANINDNVYITKDTKFLDDVAANMFKLQRRVNLDLYVDATVGNLLTITAVCGEHTSSITSDFLLEESKGKTLTKDDLFKQLDRLKDTPYQINHFEANLDNVFIPMSKLNELRRTLIEDLNESRLQINRVATNINDVVELNVEPSHRHLSAFCTTEEQYLACVEAGIETIYYNNYIRRNEAKYKEPTNLTLVGGYNGIEYYYNKDTYLVSDFSLNVVNAKSVYLLHKNNVKRVTISHEITKKDITDLINTYHNDYNSACNLEMIVYGRAHLLNTKYCPLKVNNLCGKCKTNRYAIKDNVTSFPIISHDDCTTTIVNGKILNLLDELNNIPSDINVFRLQFTIESKDEVKQIIELATKKLNGDPTVCFNKETDTRGHFNKEIL